jgi:hypothetical protein
MYKVAADLAQRRARQLWLADLQGSEFQALTVGQQRDSLKQKLWSIEKQLLKQEPDSEWRLALGQVKLEVQGQLKALKPQIKRLRKSNVAECFVAVARERMTKPAFMAFFKEANRRSFETLSEPAQDPMSTGKEP